MKTVDDPFSGAGPAGPAPVGSGPVGSGSGVRAPAGPGVRVAPHLPRPVARLEEAVLTMCAKYPGLVAVEHADQVLTYRDLELTSRAVATRLTAAGIGPGDHVGLFLERGIEMVIGIIGILRSGAAYVPQDARIATEQHLEHIVTTASITQVLSTTRFTDRLRSWLPDVTVEPLHAPGSPAAPGARDRRAAGAPDTVPVPVPARPAAASDTAAVIFTSGTTGHPNGVAVRHENLVNTVLLAPGDLGVQPGERVSQLLNIAFDMAAWEIFVALTHGATLVVRGRSIPDTARTVDVIVATPSVLNTIDPDTCHRVRVAVVAGERCPQELADRWTARCRFLNSCGPTEVTIVNTIGEYRPGRPLSIGAPIPNTTVYVLDEDGNPVPDGAAGEMWAGGDCVTSGYLANPDLTAERYRPDPFLGPGYLMFRTRDLVRVNDHGEYEHLGRTDDQVKVKGFRVELDAVNVALESDPCCLRAATILVDGVGLVSYVAPRAADPEILRAAVAARHPYFYVPEHVIGIDVMPTTDRGKVDKAALRADYTRRTTRPVEQVA